jgi:hypothetical protein
MKLRTLGLFAFAIALSAFASTNAQADFSPAAVSYEQRYNKPAQLDIAEPAGFKVAVTIDGNVVSETIPHVFQLPDADAYIPVKLTAPDGTSYSEKVKVKAHHVTRASFKYTAPQGGDNKAKADNSGRKFLGHIVNASNTCKPNGWAMQFQFLEEPSGNRVLTLALNPGQDKEQEMLGGTYSVRVAYWDSAAREYKHLRTEEHVDVKRDDWRLKLACPKGDSNVERIR